MSGAGSDNGRFLDVIRGNMAALSDDELLRVITVQAQEYRKEALDLAWAELGRRGIQAPSPQEIETIQEQSAEERRNAPLHQLRWLKFYIFLIGGDSATAVYSFIQDFRQLGAGWLAFRSCVLVLLCFLLPGMIRRKGWAYYLNWVYLAVTVYKLWARSSTWWSLPIYFAIWALPNFIYFRKRRRLFIPQASETR